MELAQLGQVLIVNHEQELKQVLKVVRAVSDATERLVLERQRDMHHGMGKESEC